MAKVGRPSKMNIYFALDPRVRPVIEAPAKMPVIPRAIFSLFDQPGQEFRPLLQDQAAGLGRGFAVASGGFPGLA